MKLNKNLVGILGFIIVWQVVSLLGIFNPIFFASPIEVVNEAINMFQTSGFYSDIIATLYRVIISIVISVVIGVPIGLLLGYFSKVYLYIGELIDFFRSIPPVVV